MVVDGLYYLPLPASLLYSSKEENVTSSDAGSEKGWCICHKIQVHDDAHETDFFVPK